jgi:predicted Zn-dependent peptidase
VARAGLWMSDESPASRAGRNAAQTLIYGAPVSSEDSEARIEATTAEDLRRVGRKVLASGLSATSVLGPKSANGAGAAFAKRLKLA